MSGIIVAVGRGRGGGGAKGGDGACSDRDAFQVAEVKNRFRKNTKVKSAR